MTDFSRTILLGHLFPKKKKMGQFFLEQIFLEHLFHGTKIYSGKNKNLSWEKVGFRDKKLSQKNKSRKKLFPKNCPLEKSCLGKSVPEKNERERERQQWSECTAHRTHTVSAHSDTIFFCKILINGAWYDSKIGYRWAGGGGGGGGRSPIFKKGRRLVLMRRSQITTYVSVGPVSWELPN